MKEAEAGGDTTRKSDIKNVQESTRQLHGNICIFSRAIEHLVNENEPALGRSPIAFLSSVFMRGSSRDASTTSDPFTLLGHVR